MNTNSPGFRGFFVIFDIMKESKRTEIKVGLVTLAGLVLLVLGIALGSGAFGSATQEQVRFRFANSGGIKISAPITVDGVKRGYVTAITSTEDGVIVEGLMDNTADLNKDAYGQIKILEITGGKKIELNRGISSSPLPKGSIIKGEATMDIGDLVALIGSAGNDILAIVKNLDTIAKGGAKLLGNDSVITSIKSAVANADQLLSNANMLLAENRAALDKTFQNLNVITTDLKDAIKKHEPTVGNLLAELDRTMDDARKLIQNLDKAAGNADGLISNVNGIVDDIKKSGSIANKLLYDKAFADRFAATFDKLDSLIRKIDEHGVNVNLRLGTRP